MNRLRSIGPVLLIACTGDLTNERDSEKQPPLTLNVGAADTALFIGAGDIASCAVSYKDEATAAIIREYPAAQVFALGDNAYPDGTPAEYECYHASWGAFKDRTRPVPGNHDYHTTSPTPAAGYYGYFGAAAGEPSKGYYAFDLGTWRIYALNSELNASGRSSQVAWLEADLLNHPAQCILAYWHRPLFTSSAVHPGQASMKALWSALEAAGAEIVLSAHNHHYERFAPQTADGAMSASGIRQFVVGGGGSSSLYNFLDPPIPNSEARYKGHGVLLLRLYPGGYAWEHLGLPGAGFADTGSSACSGSSGPPPPSSIQLTVTGREDATKQYMTLSWSGATGAMVDVYRNGALIKNTENDGHYTNTRNFTGSATYVYKVCQAGTTTCSNEATVEFGGETNAPPTADFGSSCSGLTCNFTDQSTDPDGSLASWSWSFGDGGTATARHPSRTYGASGTYTVTLTVTDDRGAAAEHAAPVTVTGSPSSITLTVTGREDATKQYMTLSWSGASGSIVDVYRNGSLIKTTENDGHYTNSRTFTGDASYTYRVCQAGSTVCSNEATVAFGDGAPPSNVAPAASFSASCSGLTCSFTDGSTDSDGTVTGWSWTFGDGSGSTARNPSRTYSSAGTYTVTLTATDDDGAAGEASKQVTASASSSAISLMAAGRTDGTTQYMTLDWTGASGASVDVFRNGIRITTTPNDGHYVNSRTFQGAITYVYQVCESGTTTCSNEATVTFE